MRQTIHALAVTLTISVAGGVLIAQSPAAAPRPDFSGTWSPVDPAKSDTLFDVGLTAIPGSARLTIEQTPNRFTTTVTIPDARLDPYLNFSGRFSPTTIFRIYETGRQGGAGAGGPVLPARTSWVGNRLYIPNMSGGVKRTMTTFEMDGERLKMETVVEVDAVRRNTVTELFGKVKP